jgi:hypothetical protein
VFPTSTAAPPLPAPTLGVLATAFGLSTGLGYPRFSKLDFTSYDGTEYPLNWLTHCEQFFRGQRTLALDCIWLMSYHLISEEIEKLLFAPLQLLAIRQLALQKKV